ncbi:hypothetical protein TEA_008244 [Camellia sinensis var. sinensis]|uniref:Glycine-rich protein n=1 Tax=Camellia sinensis var. sinensis TaxID=542762 RepID=A0A4S4DG07_CAMSN|nr:hypothetical protein TEA_008244 [Camellia sinensis var. sinensis]
MPTMANSEVTDGPVLSFINKRLRALRKKLNRIVQLEDSIAQGKPINKEQEDLIVSKPSVTASIDELEKLRHPLSAAIAEEINLAVQRHHTTPSDDTEKDRNVAEVESKAVEDLLNLLYFGSMFDVKSQNDFTSTMLTRTHERGCCLTYDYVTDDDAADLLGERDLDLISMLGGLLISRPVDSSLSHMNALRRCIEHAKQWLSNSDHPIDSDPNVTYAGLRAKLNKIMASDYFTTTPEMKATVEMAAAAAGNYASFQVPVHGSMVPVQVEGSDEQYQQDALASVSTCNKLPCGSTLGIINDVLISFDLHSFQIFHTWEYDMSSGAASGLWPFDEDTTNFQGNETYDNQSGPVEEPHKMGEFGSENHTEVLSETELDELQAEGKNQRDVESKDQHYVSRRNYQNQKGGRGGGRRGGGYSNGRGGRGSSRGGGPYQNGHNQYYDQPRNYNPRNYYNNRGRGGRGGGELFQCLDDAAYFAVVSDASSKTVLVLPMEKDLGNGSFYDIFDRMLIEAWQQHSLKAGAAWAGLDGNRNPIVKRHMYFFASSALVAEA